MDSKSKANVAYPLGAIDLLIFHAVVIDLRLVYEIFWSLKTDDRSCMESDRNHNDSASIRENDALSNGYLASRTRAYSIHSKAHVENHDRNFT